MTAQEAIDRLTEIRRKWRRPNASTIEFSKAEGEVFQAFRQDNPGSWESSWPAIQREAHEKVN